MKRHLALLMFIGLYSTVVVSGGYTGPFEVVRFSSLGGSGIFEIYGNWTNVDQCSNASKFIVGGHSSDNEMSQKAKYSTILGAYMAGKTVELYVDGCNVHGQPNVKGIYVPRACSH
ncbi:hypothetical protein [Exilibacterium tricleocarpae]|uniref:hypothetical protein n=1 Tax=Exilibacterium tricleocarpae TaxID=2591008 RepID=UPI0015D14E5A|nr:hypothetical protein [Exilibacterium tricleocarpae]